MMLILLAGLQSRPARRHRGRRDRRRDAWQIFRYMTFPHLRQYLELGALLGSIYVVQTFDAVFVITSGGLGTANLPYTIYQTFYSAQDYGRASAAGVVVVIGTIIIATFALRTVSRLFREEGGDEPSPTSGPFPRPATRGGAARQVTQAARQGTLLGVLAWLVGLVFILPVAVDGPDLLPQRGRRRDQPAVHRSRR